MNKTTRKTRACTIETLDEKLRSAIRDHEAQYGLADLESDVLMCCETISVQQKKGFFGGIKTTLSAVYVTRKWLAWADSSQVNDAIAGTAQLKHIDVIDYSNTARYSISPDQGLNITGRYTNKNRTGITFIVLDSDTSGQKFRNVLQEALQASRETR